MDFLNETENEIIRNIIDPDEFIADSFQVVPMAVGIKLIVGRPKMGNGVKDMLNPDRVMVQGVRFEKPDWDLQSALEWLSENQKDFKSFEAKKTFANDLKKIDGVEIFSAGEWNGDEYTEKDLDEMVRAFNENKMGVRPHLKLGHDDNQKLLQNDGLPAAGWVEKLYRKGDKLMADFVDIPAKIYELIENKAYRKVSSEIYLGVKIKDKVYDYMLGAVALLGADTPGVMNLKDIIAMYGFNSYNQLKTYTDGNVLKVYDYFENQKGIQMEKTEKEIQLEAKLAEIQKQLDEKAEEVKQFRVELDDAADKLEKTEQEKKEYAAKIAEAEMAKVEAELEQTVEGMISDKLITKGMKPFVKALLADEPETKKYSFEQNDETVEFGKVELVKEIAKMFAKKSEVNLDESSLEGDVTATKQEYSVEEIEQYADENKISFSAAYKQLFNGKLKVEK